jgi:hypothetical protein
VTGAIPGQAVRSGLLLRCTTGDAIAHCFCNLSNTYRNKKVLEIQAFFSIGVKVASEFSRGGRKCGLNSTVAVCQPVVRCGR